MAKNKGIGSRVAISRGKIGGELPILVNEITDKCLYSGFFGTLDSARMKVITERIIDLLKGSGSEIVLIDLTNVELIDSAVAVHLVKLGKTLKMSGSEVIFCGIKPEIAQTMVTAEINLLEFRISKDLKAAIKEVFIRQGIALVPLSELGKAEQERLTQQQQQ